MDEDIVDLDAETRLAEFARKAIESKECEVSKFLQQPRIWGLVQAMSRDGVSLREMTKGVLQAMGRKSLSHNTFAKALREVAVAKGDQEILARFGWASPINPGSALEDAVRINPLDMGQTKYLIPALPTHIQPGPTQMAGQASSCHACNGLTESWLVNTPDGLVLPVWVCEDQTCGAAICKSVPIWMCPLCWGLCEPTTRKDGWRCLSAKCPGRRDSQGKPIPADIQTARPQLRG